MIQRLISVRGYLFGPALDFLLNFYAETINDALSPWRAADSRIYLFWRQLFSERALKTSNDLRCSGSPILGGGGLNSSFQLGGHTEVYLGV